LSQWAKVFFYISDIIFNEAIINKKNRYLLTAVKKYSQSSRVFMKLSIAKKSGGDGYWRIDTHIPVPINQLIKRSVIDYEA